ncbi:MULTISPECIES: ribonuclease III [unclassified Fusibacter]|uniref:ribonuclease III n=1 Tax=unclassified Fusibacter TaxID=2624464 RepID=UPI0010102C47|nr:MULTISPECIES: ribonuclease III [unclassified Fusibacter]MCK8058085.1 ribonuclease III [Fusibacter sp. A2]NPE20667.1 ribonuclease III [Fusibacter sp. A1]RXV62873.1 ribonuclease III [Fusibacter sp. A1]
MNRNYNELEKKIKYQFRDYSLLEEALTHSSHANEKSNTGGNTNLNHNERLEFLGDSVLSIVISDFLFMKYPDFPEGDLTKLRAKIVCEPTLAESANEISLGQYMYFGKGEAQTGGRERPSILADAFEALIASIYLDGGLSEARRFILETMHDKIEDSIHGRIFLDYKTALQERVQASSQLPITYEIINEEGPDHQKVFSACVLIGSVNTGIGKGKSKKEAEQLAAKMALKALSK